MKVACMTLGKTKQSLAKAIIEYQSHAQEIDTHINATIAVRCQDLIVRSAVQGVATPMKPCRGVNKDSIAKSSSSSSLDSPLSVVPVQPGGKKRKLRRNELLPTAQLRMAYPGIDNKERAPNPPANVLARQFHCSAMCVAYTRAGLAELQVKKTETTVKTKVRTHKYRYAVHKKKWDETQHNGLNMPVIMKQPLQLVPLEDDAAASASAAAKKEAEELKKKRRKQARQQWLKRKPGQGKNHCI